MSTTKTRTGTVPEQTTHAAPVPAAPPKAIGARRRRPALIGVSLALIAAGGLAGAMVLTSSAHKSQVLVIAQPLEYGQVISLNDLTTASISSDPALHTVPASELGQVVGKRAAAPLKAGSTLTSDDVTSHPLVGSYEQLVGVLAKPGQLPATPLSPGAQVLAVTTPGQDTALPASPPQYLPARVVRVGTPDSSGNVVVDLAIDSSDGPTLAARAATGRVAIVLASPQAVG
ncbi:MAG: flagella basal body P-ring formation protein FlgA [Streptomycetaceae bacterium]|nr:flagella basal body P-ring formation protein FlgA [Streptomycetaceae bacterium]